MSLRRAAIGSLLKGGPTAAPTKGKAKATAGAREESGAYLAFLRKLPCVLTGKRPVEAAHIRFADKAWGKPLTGIGVKPSDRWCLPLSPDKHREQHAAGNERTWWKKQGVDPLVVATRLYFEAAGDLAKGEAIILEIRAAMGGAK